MLKVADYKNHYYGTNEILAPIETATPQQGKHKQRKMQWQARCEE